MNENDIVKAAEEYVLSIAPDPNRMLTQKGADLARIDRSCDDRRDAVIRHVSENILPKYSAFDKGHNTDHAVSVINESCKLAEENGADLLMAFVVAAYHDLGLSVERERHHIFSAEILKKDELINRLFTDKEIAIMAEAIEDHRASAENPPRSIYGRIVAEADRQIIPESILRRTIQYGLRREPDMDFEYHYKRAVSHLNEKYAEGGYMKLYLNSERNVKGLAELREIIADEKRLKQILQQIFNEEVQ